MKKYSLPLFGKTTWCKKKQQITPLMILDGEKWHCLRPIKLFPLFSGIISTNKGDFYCLNYLYSLRTKIKPTSHKKVCKYHAFLMF